MQVNAIANINMMNSISEHVSRAEGFATPL